MILSGNKSKRKTILDKSTPKPSKKFSTKTSALCTGNITAKPQQNHTFFTRFSHVSHRKSTAKAEGIPQRLNATCPLLFQTHRLNRRTIQQYNQKRQAIQLAFSYFAKIVDLFFGDALDYVAYPGGIAESGSNIAINEV